MPATWIQEPASYPPPGWTRTPLYLELCAMKQHVASLTDDNIQLRGTVTDLRETLSHLSSEVGKMKRAFGALSNLVDAEVDSCRGESSKLWLEVTQAKESGVLMQQAIDKVEHGLAQQRAHDDARARASDEWIERTVLELRDDVERRWQSWMEDSRQRTLDAQALARDLEQQSNEMQRVQLALGALSTEERETRGESEAAVKGIQSELRAAVAELDRLREAREKEARDGEARESELARNLTNLVAETDGALDRLGRQLRVLGEEGQAVREAQSALSTRVTQAEDAQGEAASKVDEVERAVQAVGAQTREQRQAVREMQASSYAGVKEAHAAIARIEREIREIRGLQAGGGSAGVEIGTVNVAPSLPQSPPLTRMGSRIGTPAADRRVLPQAALVRRLSDMSVASPMSPTRRM